MVLSAAVQALVAVDILRRVQHAVAILVFDDEDTGSVLTAAYLNGFNDSVAVDVLCLVEHAVAVDIFAPVDLVLDVRQGVGGDDGDCHAVDTEIAGQPQPPGALRVRCQNTARGDGVDGDFETCFLGSTVCRNAECAGVGRFGGQQIKRVTEAQFFYLVQQCLQADLQVADVVGAPFGDARSTDFVNDREMAELKPVGHKPPRSVDAESRERASQVVHLRYAVGDEHEGIEQQIRGRWAVRSELIDLRAEIVQRDALRPVGLRKQRRNEIA